MIIDLPSSSFTHLLYYREHESHRADKIRYVSLSTVSTVPNHIHNHVPYLNQSSVANFNSFTVSYFPTLLRSRINEGGQNKRDWGGGVKQKLMN